MENFLKREEARAQARKKASKDKKNAYIVAPKDSFNSTYIYYITFDNGKKIPGYSANSGFQEKNDKQAVLINYVLRMYKRGYLDYNNPPKDRIQYIDIFLNHRTEEKIIFRLYYDYYEVYTTSDNFMIFAKFLDNFYTSVKNKESVKTIYYKYYRSDKSKQIDPFDYKSKRFITQKSLTNFCSIMYDKKVFTMEQTQHFELKYIETHKLTW